MRVTLSARGGGSRGSAGARGARVAPRPRGDWPPAPAALLRRLAASLDVLGAGAVDLPERQQTLRATVEWSVGLLQDAERSLLETAAVFTDGWALEAVAQVADLTEDRALELSEELARHSLIYLDTSAPGPRSRMLETIRVFVAERLATRPDATEIERRHAGYYRALAEQADHPLRGAGQGEWLERLEAEAGNLPAAPSLGPQARAELEWAAMVTANEVGDDTATLAARQRLWPLLEEVGDPFLHAVCQLALAW